jgi:hypothetical protein
MSWTSKAKTGLQIAGMTLVLFLVVDLIASTLMPQALINVFGEGSLIRISSRVYHHDLQPNVDAEVRWGELKHRLCTDANGFKNPCDLSAEKRNNKQFDVAFIGDSFTEGMGYPYEQTFVGLYAASHPDLRVANLAVSSYSPSIYLKKMEYLLKHGYSFKTLVLLPDISDIQDEAIYYQIQNGMVADRQYGGLLVNATRRFQECCGAYFSMTANLLVKVSKDIDRFIDRTTGKLKKVAKTSYPDHPRAHWTFTPNSDEYGTAGVQGGIDQALESMRELKTLLDAHNIKLVVTVYPWDTQLKHGQITHPGASIWRDFCQQQHCAAFIDLNPRFFAEAKRLGLDSFKSQYLIPGDTHFNEAGNQLIFQSIDRAIPTQ